MDLEELEIKVNALDSSFTSSAHTIQHRLFGFITTNIRSVQTITTYIQEILPVYIENKKTIPLGKNIQKIPYKKINKNSRD